jgi:hypothetical protein
MVNFIANFAGAGSESGLHMPDPSEGPSIKQSSYGVSTALPPLPALEPLLFRAAASLRKGTGYPTQFPSLEARVIAWTQLFAVAGMPSCNLDS